jgi:hypothetical protein
MWLHLKFCKYYNNSVETRSKIKERCEKERCELVISVTTSNVTLLCVRNVSNELLYLNFKEFEIIKRFTHW